MIVWEKDEAGFVVYEQVKHFYVMQQQNKSYAVYADGIQIGSTKAEEDGKKVINKIAVDFCSNVLECYPW